MSGKNRQNSPRWTDNPLNQTCTAGILWGMRRALPILAIALAGCASDIDLGGRPCSDEGQCIAGYTCDPAAERCVTEGDACDTEAALLPCSPDDTTCQEAGCRLCEEGTWGEIKTMFD